MKTQEGFEAYNIFKKNIKDIKQLYDFTYHLYQTESNNLKKELHNPPKKTIHTKVNSISHGFFSLYNNLISKYPYKLRQYLLVSAVTSVEVYLTNIIQEIFERDDTPFKEESTSLNFPKNYLLNLGSINQLQETIINKDIRSLTSGGFSIIEKYYKKVFNINFRDVGNLLNDVKEIHNRRHLFVHRDGTIDYDYSLKYATQGLKEGSKLKIEHEYFISSIDKLSEFVGKINKALTKKYPDNNRRPLYEKGNICFDCNKKNLMIEIAIIESKFNHVEYLKTLQIKGREFFSLVVQITTIDKCCIIFLCGNHEEINPFIRPISEHKSIKINKIIEIENVN